MLRLAAALSFLGSLLFGLGFCALLPPFEGFDETGHYSYIQQLAETGTWPRMTDPLSAEVEDYLRVAPSASSTGERGSYKGFFAASPDVINAGAAAVHTSRDASRRWRPGNRDNWEGQHPPLYYALLAPIYSVLKGLSLDAQLIVLRSISLILAWTGLVIAALSAWGWKSSADETLVALVPALWPGLIPMWFPEMARLGNDSLVIFLVAITMMMLRRVLTTRATAFDSVALGFACGLGLLTKATFLPVVAALGLTLCYRAWRARHDPVEMREGLRSIVLFSLTTIAIAGWWYVKSVIDTGSIVASYDDLILARKGGGLVKNLPEHLGWREIVGNLDVIVNTFVWTGTWSFFLTPARIVTPILALLVVIVAAWASRLRRMRQISALEGTALLAIFFFAIGLLQANVVNIAANGLFAIPAWYLHSVVPIFAPIVGCGLAEAAGWRTPRPIIVALVVYPVLFLSFATVWQMIGYAGCFEPPLGSLHFSSAVNCGIGPSELFRRLALIANPVLAIPLLIAGWLAMFVGTVLIVWRSFVPTAGPSRGP